MLLVALRLGLLGAVCSFFFTASVCVGCFLLLPATLGFASQLLFCVVGPRSRAGSLSCGVPFLLSFALLHLFPPLRLFVTHA